MTPLYLPSLATPPRPVDSLEAEREALRERERALERNRQQFDEEQRLLRDYWRRQQQDEWDRLRAEAARITDAAARQRLKLQDKQTELELRRRAEQQRAEAFAAERAAWRERQAREQATLAAAEQKLADERKQFEADRQAWRQARLDGERLRTARDKELEGLEKRIGGYRSLLGQLQDEVAGLERRLEATEPVGGFVEAVGELSQAESLLGELAAMLEDLFNEHLRLTDCRDELLALRESWALEWDRAHQALTEKDSELAEEAEAQKRRQDALRRLAATVARQLEELAFKEQQLRAQEEDLARRETQSRCEHSRASAESRAKAIAARTRQRQADRLVEELRRAELKHLVRVEAAERALAASQRALFDRHEQLDLREAWLDQREKDLLARGWVLSHAEQQLTHRDPDPAGAQEELDRRLEVFRKLADRAEQRDQERADQLDEALGELEAFRQRLLAARAELDEERVQLQLLRLTATQEREQMDSERVRWRAAFKRLKQECRLLRRRNREAAEQAERLTLALLEPQPVRPTLAVAA